MVIYCFTLDIIMDKNCFIPDVFLRTFKLLLELFDMLMNSLQKAKEK